MISIAKDHPILIRYSGSSRDTLGMLFFQGVFQHYTIEDEYRAVKVHSETRIPAGIYPLRIRTYGTHHLQYAAKFPQMHKGMIEICNIPNFKDVLYHIGNTEKDTDACLLPGDVVNNNQVSGGLLQQSTQAYVRTYPKLLSYIENNAAPQLEIIDLDRPA